MSDKKEERSMFEQYDDDSDYDIEIEDMSEQEPHSDTSFSEKKVSDIPVDSSVPLDFSVLSGAEPESEVINEDASTQSVPVSKTPAEKPVEQPEKPQTFSTASKPKSFDSESQQSVENQNGQNANKASSSEAPQFMSTSGNQNTAVNENPVQNNSPVQDNSAGESQSSPDADNQGPSDVQDDNSNLSTEDKKNDGSFLSFKEAANLKGGKKGQEPEKLNKTLITILIAVLVAIVLILLVWQPSFTRKKKDFNEGKPKPTQHQNVNYESLATNTQQNSGDYVNNYGNSGNSDYLDSIAQNGNDNNVNPKYQNPNDNLTVNRQDAYQTGFSQQNGNGTTSSTVSSVVIPDTRNDSLQGKTINGIKGITPTQESYCTNYELQKIQNTADAAKASHINTETRPSMEQYTNDLLSAYNSTANSYAQQNDQSGKNNFYNQGRGTGGNGIWNGINTIWQGTIFEAALTSEINTDLPGEVTARVTKNIYSSQDGRYLLIPQNSILIGSYNSSISYSQNRTQVVWNTLIRPDGYQISLGSMNGTDAKGASGIKGLVNDHPLAYMKAIVLMSVVSISNSELQNTINTNQNEYLKELAANAQEVSNTLGQKIIDRAMDVQPTIRIKSGTKINIVVNQNLTIPAVENFPVTQKYQRGK